MRKNKLINRIKFFALCALFLILGLPSVKAQGKSNLQKLEGTKWKASASFPTPPDTWLWEFTYAIEKNNKIRVHIVVAVQGIRQKLDYNMTTKSYELVNSFTTIVEREQNEVGTYQQTGNSITINFPSHQVDAKLGRNQMIGKITSYDGEKSVWSAEVISEIPIVKPPNNTSDGGATLAGNLGEMLEDLDKNPYPRKYEGQASGTYKISIFPEAQQSGVIKIEMDVRDAKNLKARFNFQTLSGELSGRIDANRKLQLIGTGILKGSISETKYQCSLSALAENEALTDGKYYCESGSDVIKGVFETAKKKQ
ncbi:MAG TPA: hypothetical protein VK612_12280 [Pyrinomonadaceae bacterium]|nr:hypothetical protein [Pyrinomonadaceae bacterium]